MTNKHKMFNSIMKEIQFVKVVFGEENLLFLPKNNALYWPEK